MFSRSTLRLSLLMVCAVYFVHIVQGTSCTQKAIQSFQEKMKDKDAYPFVAARKIAQEFPGCFFPKLRYNETGGTKSNIRKNTKKCRTSCESYYQKCKNAVPSSMVALRFTCKLGLSQCMYDCQPRRKPVSQACIGQCTTDFRLCFFRNRVNARAESWICVESRSICKTQSNCYRVDSIDPMTLGHRFRLWKTLKSLLFLHFNINYYISLYHNMQHLEVRQNYRWSFW